jgi:hypothetical protein
VGVALMVVKHRALAALDTPAGNTTPATNEGTAA